MFPAVNSTLILVRHAIDAPRWDGTAFWIGHRSQREF